MHNGTEFNSYRNRITRCFRCKTYFDIIINQSDNDNCNIHFTITGAFLSKGKISEEDFKQLVAINGASALIGIARGKIESLSSSIFNNGKIVIPFVNVIDYYKATISS